MQNLECEANVIKLVELVGEGANSRVYRALREDSQGFSRQLVALKVLKSKTRVQDLQSEFHRLQDLQSKYCVRVYSWENFWGQASLVMEYIEGMSLQRLLKFGSFTRSQIQEIAAQIYMGLRDLKAAGICHGDLSLANVILSESGQIKLIDFALNDGSFGTREFLSPQRLAGQGPSFESDLFALDRIVEILIGQKDGPEQRHNKIIKPRASIQKELARKLRGLLLQQNRKMITEALAYSRSNIYSRALLTGITMLLLTLPVEPSLFSKSELKIVSKVWLQVELDGKNLGYSPILRKLTPGRYLMTWKTQKRHGQQILTLIAGQTTVVKERDLESEAIRGNRSGDFFRNRAGTN